GKEDLIESAFDLREYQPDDVLEIGPLHVRFQVVPHFTQTHAVEFSAGGGRFTYGADHGPSEELIAFAHGTDVRVLEATLPEPEPEGPRGHITPGEAGEHGRRAEARRLVITHVSDMLDPAWVRAEAERGFGGPVDVAHEGATYSI